MDFGTGKDLPKNAQYFDQNEKFKSRNPRHSYGFYLFDNVPTWGLDVVKPDYSFSVSDFVEYVQAVIGDIEKRGRLPIVVGGTGLYLRGLLGQIATLGGIFDEKLRRELDSLSLHELQNRLKEKNPKTFEKMNKSDQKNPRRLIRAIEIWEAGRDDSSLSTQNPYQSLVLVLVAPIDFILKKIEKRPRGEITNEVKMLLEKKYDFSLPSMSGLGYKAFQAISEKVFSGLVTDEEIDNALLLWNQEDRQYAKRQLTFLKKYFPEKSESNLETRWVDITVKNWQEKIQLDLSKWYTES
jgi:tRNA dimethylallyltransferase